MEMCTAFSMMRLSFYFTLPPTLSPPVCCVLAHKRPICTWPTLKCSIALARYGIQCNNFIGQLNPIERHQEEPNEAYSQYHWHELCVHGSICIVKQWSIVYNGTRRCIWTVQDYLFLLVFSSSFDNSIPHCVNKVYAFFCCSSHTNIDYPNRTFTIGAKEKWILWIFYSETRVCYCPNQHQNNIEMNRIAIAGQTCPDAFVLSVGREGGAFGCVCHSHCYSIKWNKFDCIEVCVCE